ncbi:MAG: ribonuclease HII [Candidatus Omnitrophota bacterium]|jgi:ribonuclease HII
MLSFEDQAKQEGFKIIIGVDEAGRGPLAGPVVASAVILREYQFDCVIRDSKKMSARQRAKAYDEILQKGYVGLGQSDHARIDRDNILQATFHAMTQAVQDLLTKIPQEDFSETEFIKKVYLLIDGNLFKTNLPFAYKTIIQGDSLSLSIACASIMAKVTRDRIMEDYDKVYPQYGFAKHKGYPTLKHKEQIKISGLTPIHRKTFKYWV